MAGDSFAGDVEGVPRSTLVRMKDDPIVSSTPIPSAD